MSIKCFSETPEMAAEYKKRVTEDMSEVDKLKESTSIVMEHYGVLKEELDALKKSMGVE